MSSLAFLLLAWSLNIGVLWVGVLAFTHWQWPGLIGVAFWWAFLNALLWKEGK